MLSHAFTKREKMLLIILVLILLFLLWYQAIFVNVQNQVGSLNEQIGEQEDALTIDQAKSAQMSMMQAAIDQYKAQGATATAMPAFDNQQNVMNELNAILSSTNSYTLTFDDLDTSETGTVKRGVTLSFGCNSYDDAKTVLTNLAQGAYPCTIDSTSINDNSASSKSSYSSAGSGSSSVQAASSFTVTAHLTFYEKNS